MEEDEMTKTIVENAADMVAAILDDERHHVKPPVDSYSKNFNEKRYICTPNGETAYIVYPHRGELEYFQGGRRWSVKVGKRLAKKLVSEMRVDPKPAKWGVRV
jgi:hypothetical protein